MKPNGVDAINKQPLIAMGMTPDKVLKQFLSTIGYLNHQILCVSTALHSATTTAERRTLLAPLEDEVIYMNQYIASIMEYLRTYTSSSSPLQTRILSYLAEFAHSIREQTSPLRAYMTVYLHYDAPLPSLAQRLNGIIQYGQGIGKVLDTFEKNQVR